MNVAESAHIRNRHSFANLDKNAHINAHINVVDDSDPNYNMNLFTGFFSENFVIGIISILRVFNSSNKQAGAVK